jgi:cell division protein FtsW
MNSARVALIVSVLFILSLGLVMVFNTTSAEVIDRSLNVSTHLAMIKQIAYSLLGILCGFVIYATGYKNIVRLSPFLFFLCLILLSLVFLPGIGLEINGGRRWIGIEGYTFQPSELAKYLIPIYFIKHYSEKEKIESFFGFLKFISIFILPFGLIFLEPDNGTSAIIMVTLLVLFFIFRIKISYWAVPLFLAAMVGGILAYNMPHVSSRIKVYLHPELDIKGKGHQPYQAKIAAGSGQLFGKGLGESMQKLSYLPEARSDYLAAIYAEEFGFVGVLSLISLYLVITFAGFFIAINARDKVGFYLAIVMTFLISFQAFLNLGVVSGLLPSKGITLPFFSQGGTSLIVNLMALFLILSVAASSKEKKAYTDSD